MIVYIDFETRSECNLKTAGAWKYSLDPTTEVLCVGWQKENEFETSVHTIQDHFGFDSLCWSPNDKYYAHNAGFEFAIWHNICVPQFGWPTVPLEQWYCTAAKSSVVGLPRSLEDAALALGLVEQKDTAGSRLMKKLCKPRPNWSNNNRGPKWFESPEELTRLGKYCRQDVKTTIELNKRLPDLSLRERNIWLLDQRINQRGVYCDLGLVNAAIDMAEQEEQKAANRLSGITENVVTSPGQVARILDWCVSRGYACSDLRVETIDKALKDPNIKPEVYEVLTLRKELSRSSVKKYKAISNRICSDGRVRDLLVYHGAHTGRWTGAGVQIQNLFRPQFDRRSIESIGIPAIKNRDFQRAELLFGDPMALLSSSVRSVFCAKPGHDLIGADYTEIEARTLFWLVGESKALSTIKNGVGLYVDMASTIFNKPADKISKSERQLGKIAILGLGYQMGPHKFEKTCEKWGVDISLEFAEYVVTTYREKYSKVVDYWRTQNGTAMRTVQRKSSFGIYDMELSALRCNLQSGSVIRYPYPEIHLGKFDNPTLTYMGVHPITRQWTRLDTYGGKLTENIVQRLARDIMVRGMQNAENFGYKILFTVHDEIVAEIPKGRGSVSELEMLLADTPRWATGCPIEAKGWRGRRYRK